MPERLAELLAVRAVAELSPDEQAELERLMAQHPEVDPFAYQLSLPMVPASLRARLLQRAAQDSPGKPLSTSAGGSPPSGCWWHLFSTQGEGAINQAPLWSVAGLPSDLRISREAVGEAGLQRLIPVEEDG